MAERPLVAMLDFLEEATVERGVLDAVAKVEAWNLKEDSPDALPAKVIIQ